MIAQVSLHESVLKQVQLGQGCVIKIDALGAREFQGRVAYVAVLPDQNSWWANPNARLYRTDVQIAEGHPEMRPGMSCQVEILVEDIADTLYVPVQSVFRARGKNVAFVTKNGVSVEREIEVGRYNERWVQVLSGLEEGEVVLLAAPQGFAPQAGASEEPESAFPDAQGAPTGVPGAAGAPGAAHAGVEASSPAAQVPAAPGESGRRGFGDGERPQISEEMRKRFEALTPEERAKLREQFQRGGNRSGGDSNRSGGDSNRSGGDSNRSGGDSNRSGGDSRRSSSDGERGASETKSGG
jgi:HlyD family secretion protein